MIIGIFAFSNDSYTGQLTTLTCSAELVIAPAHPSPSANAPQWRVLRVIEGGFQSIGAGWNRTGDRAGAYIALELDDPVFAAPIYANLLRSNHGDDAFHLLWSRAQSRERS